MIHSNFKPVSVIFFINKPILSKKKSQFWYFFHFSPSRYNPRTKSLYQGFQANFNKRGTAIEERKKREADREGGKTVEDGIPLRWEGGG